MKTIKNQVSLALILLFAHERGELCNKTIVAAASEPKFTIVNAAGAAIDITVADYDGTDAYGIHTGDGVVYWAHSVFNSKYIVWPADITEPVKTLIIDHLEKSFLIIK